MWAGGAAPRLPSRPSVAPAGVPAMVWHLYGAIFTDLNTNGYCLIVSRFISQTSPAPPQPSCYTANLCHLAYSAAITCIDLQPPPRRPGDGARRGGCIDPPGGEGGGTPKRQFKRSSVARR